MLGKGSVGGLPEGGHGRQGTSMEAPVPWFYGMTASVSEETWRRVGRGKASCSEMFAEVGGITGVG